MKCKHFIALNNAKKCVNKHNNKKYLLKVIVSNIEQSFY